MGERNIHSFIQGVDDASNVHLMNSVEDDISTLDESFYIEGCLFASRFGPGSAGRGALALSGGARFVRRRGSASGHG